jgi:RNA polymerase sigma factor (sigma-70 family)
MNTPNSPLPSSCAAHFQAWLAQVLPQLYQSAARYRSFRAGRPLDIDDLVQETCVRALRSAAAFRGSTLEELRLWLCGILRHCAADLLSGARRIASAEAEAARRAVVTAPSAQEQVLLAEICVIIVAAVARLPERMRMIVEGCAAGMRLVDLGQRLQQSPDAIRKAKQRAFTKLRSVAVALAYEWGKKQRQRAEETTVKAEGGDVIFCRVGIKRASGS